MNSDLEPVSDERFVLAFYGVDPSPKSGEEFFHSVVHWISDLGYPPDKLGVMGKGYSGKVGDFRRIRTKLDKAGFAAVESFDVHASKPNAVVSGMEFFASASFCDAGTDGGYAIVAVPSSLSAKEIWSPFARKIVLNVRPAYGIGYRRELSLGPKMYAIGICQGLGVGLTGEAYENARNISRWADIGMEKALYRKGLLREVYPWNFLTCPQLEKKIGSTPLEEWIRQDPDRGTLSAFAEDVVLWEVEEARISDLSRALHEAGAIFDWRKHA